MRAELRTPERAEVIARARAWSEKRDQKLFTTLDLSQRLGVSLKRVTRLLYAAVGIEPTDAEVAALDAMLQIDC